MRSVWAVAFLVSALLHLILLLGVQFEGGVPSIGSFSAPVTLVQPATGTRVEQIAIVADDLVEDDALPVRFPVPRIRFDVPSIPGLPVVRDVPPGAITPPRGARSFRERLEPGALTPQVWVPTSPIHSSLDKESAAAARLSGRLDAYNDSVALAAAAAARAVDWTKTDADGGRWGVSPAGLHLGDITIPIPVNFSAGPGKRDEIAGRVRDWNELQSQAERMGGKETFEERVKAIRERKAKERSEGKTPP